MSYGFYSKFRTLSSSAQILKIGKDLTKLWTVKRWELFSETQCRHRPKSGAAVPLPMGETYGSPSSIMSPEPRHTSLPGGILIHPAVWTQYMGRKL